MEQIGKRRIRAGGLAMFQVETLCLVEHRVSAPRLIHAFALSYSYLEQAPYRLSYIIGRGENHDRRILDSPNHSKFNIDNALSRSRTECK